mgnify:CR=1 FL=1
MEYRDALRQICGVQLFKSRTLFVFIYEFWITYVSPSEVAYPKEVVRMLLVLILITTGIFLSQMTITSGGGTL